MDLGNLSLRMDFEDFMISELGDLGMTEEEAEKALYKSQVYKKVFNSEMELYPGDFASLFTDLQKELEGDLND